MKGWQSREQFLSSAGAQTDVPRVIQWLRYAPPLATLCRTFGADLDGPYLRFLQGRRVPSAVRSSAGSASSDGSQRCSEAKPLDQIAKMNSSPERAAEIRTLRAVALPELNLVRDPIQWLRYAPPLATLCRTFGADRPRQIYRASAFDLPCLRDSPLIFGLFSSLGFPKAPEMR